MYLQTEVSCGDIICISDKGFFFSILSNLDNSPPLCNISTASEACIHTNVYSYIRIYVRTVMCHQWNWLS